MFGRQSKYMIKIKGILLLNTNGQKPFPQGECNLQHGEMKGHPAYLVMIALFRQYVLMDRGLSSNILWKLNKEFLKELIDFFVQVLIHWISHIFSYKKCIYIPGNCRNNFLKGH